MAPNRGCLSAVALAEFAQDERGVATIDWVVLCCAATAMAVLFLNQGTEDLSGYSAGVRDEIQSSHFDTSWTASLPVPPAEDQLP